MHWWTSADCGVEHGAYVGRTGRHLLFEGGYREGALFTTSGSVPTACVLRFLWEASKESTEMVAGVRLELTTKGL